jgi:hypothetical protein
MNPAFGGVANFGPQRGSDNVHFGKRASYSFRLGEKLLVKRILVLVAVVTAALVFSSGAFANSVKCAHGSMCGAGSLEPPTTGTSDGTLPFTGLDLAGIAVVGGLLLITGLTLQRASRRRR